MATTIDGESSLGRVLMRPLSPSGDVTLYCWPQLWIRHHPRHSPGHSLYHIALVQ